MLGSSYGARDYRGILNIAASKSWISISYIISAALYKYDKRVVYAGNAGIVDYSSVRKRTVLNPSLKFSEFVHGSSHILQSRNVRLYCRVYGTHLRPAAEGVIASVTLVTENNSETSNKLGSV